MGPKVNRHLNQLTSKSSLLCLLRICWLVMPKLGDIGAGGGRTMGLDILPMKSRGVREIGLVSGDVVVL